MADPDVAATCKGIRVPRSPFLTETRIKRINEARYEEEEITGALAVVRPDDRVLELGAGLGIVGAVIAGNARPEAVLSFEANPDLIPHINKLHAMNQLDGVIELRNQVLLTAPDQPSEVSFFLRNSFLGSSLIDQEARQTREVRVPTARFGDVQKSFRPTVLVMDIEGGELEFLAHTDLDGIRAIVIELHPGVYGVEGMKRCKTALRRLGFQKNEAHSTRFVWTCTREIVEAVTSPPSPDGGWSESLHRVEGAIVSGPQAQDFTTPSGVMGPNGEDIAQGALWRRKRRINQPFSSPTTPPEDIGGTWLWGGTLWRNFAHFITESTSRLWALDHLGDEKPEGLLFIPRRNKGRHPTQRFQRQFLDALGIDLPIRIVNEHARVERLIVPGQGFGIGGISAGTERFRSFMTTRLGAEISPEGGKSLYISRSLLGPNRGSVVAEARIEQELAAQGYDIFHPERHDIATQIARYKAAERIVACEGSALHLLGYLGLRDQKLAILPRRRSSATRFITAQIRSFTGQAPLVPDVLNEVWHHNESDRARLSTGELDLPALQAALLAGGFLEPGPAWVPASEAEIDAALGGTHGGLIAAE